MREIKFKGKPIFADGHQSNYFVYGHYFQLIQNGNIRHVIHSLNDGGKYIDPDTLGEFTGIYDKNGEEVYEGDIVKIKTLQGIVTWHPNGYFCIHTYKCDISEVSYTAIGDMVDYLHKDLYDDGIEVIGNIHDNPELMEGGQE